MTKIGVTACFCAWLVPATSFAATGTYEHQGILRAAILDKPNDPESFAVDHQNIISASYREAGLISFPKRIKFDYAAYLIASHMNERDDLDHLGVLFTDPRHRSAGLDFYLTGSATDDLYLKVDRANLRFRLKKIRFTVGRTPIDLSKSIIFRPNDIFSPSNFNPIDPMHKPGVDAVQIAGPLAPLGEWKVLGVVGYEPEVSADIDIDGNFIAPTNRPSGEQSSVLASYINTFKEYAFHATFGLYRKGLIVLASTEGEINKSLGLRIEAKQVAESDVRRFSLVIGLDYRINDKNILFNEFFLNGQGFATTEELKDVINTPYQPLSQLGQKYLGIGISSDITPLLTLKSLAQHNLSDSSSLLTTTISYSVNSRIDVSALAILPQGDAPFESAIITEYGGYPQAFALEGLVRW